MSETSIEELRMQDSVADQLVTLARTQTVEGADGEFAVLPNGTLKRIGGETQAKSPPEFIIADVKLKTINALHEYVNRFKTTATAIFADVDARHIEAVIDYHDSGRVHAKPVTRDAQGEKVVNYDMDLVPSENTVMLPDRCRHRASVRMSYSEEFEEWDAIEGEWHDQIDFLKFLEQNATDVLSPTPSSLLEMVTDFAAIEDVEFKSSTRLQNGDRELMYRKESVPKGTITIPNELSFNMPIYFGEEPQQFKALFRYRINAGSLSLRIDWHRIKQAKLKGFSAACERLLERTGVYVFAGAIPQERWDGIDPKAAGISGTG
ncbi:MAG: DUF2303 family protein [Henriciella sp.]|nr:DUF2303 family protein [Henriciella sp.]